MTTEIEMTEEQVRERYGVTDKDVGLRPRGWWIVDEIDDEERIAGAQVGDLCIKTRDGGSNDVDFSAGKYDNFRGSAEDNFDCTYRYYYFSPLSS